MAQKKDLSNLEELGRGITGIVFKYPIKGSNQFFAVKRIESIRVNSNEETKKYLTNEVNIMKSLNHPNIVKYVNFVSDKDYYYIIMEYVKDGDLAKCLEIYRLKYRKPFSEEIVQYLMKQIVSAIKYIHNKNIIHRDLKLENIMVNFNNDIDKQNVNMMKATVKIIDFGISAIGSKDKLVYSLLGTPKNMAPTILMNYEAKNSIRYGKEIDIWSLGTICYEMFIGQPVFNSKDMNILKDEIKNIKYILPTKISKEIVSFINGMLQYDGKYRLTIDQLSNHPFLTKNVNNFTPINVRKVSNKIINNQSNINVKRNKSIWAIFNEEDEKKLLNINSKYVDNDDIPINEEDNNYKRLNTTNFNNRVNNQNNNINQQYKRTETFNYSHKYMFGGGKNFYGQNMYSKDHNYNQKNHNTWEQCQKYWLNQQQMNNNPQINLPQNKENVYNSAHISNLPSFNPENNFSENS